MRNKESLGGLHPLGSFEITSGAMYATDPCYDRETTQDTLLTNVANGRWSASVLVEDEGGAWGGRNSVIYAYHANGSPEWTLNFVEVPDFEVGVDSGQAGFFDASRYVGGEDEAFYDRVCELTLEGLCAGVIDFGAVSSSGYGDGSYRCFVAKNPQGEIVAAKIVFIDDEPFGDEAEAKDDESGWN